MTTIATLLVHCILGTVSVENAVLSAPAQIQKISPVRQPVVLPAQGTKEVFDRYPLKKLVPRSLGHLGQNALERV
jgi:hypothetical protein